MAEKKSWRDVYKVHPAADLFPMLPEDELRKLGEDIRWRGLEHPIVLWAPDRQTEPMVIDGRNRLDAMELVGIEPFYRTKEGGYHIQAGRNSMVSDQEVRYGIDPYQLAISLNIRRRHLTKELQADLIVKVVAAGADFAKLARSVKRDNGGHVQGSAKDPLKHTAVEAGKKHGISKRTMERSIAKAKGPTLQRKPKIEPGTKFAKGGMPPTAPKPTAPKPTGNVEDVVKKIMAFVERNLSDKSHESLSYLREQLAAAIQDRMRSAPRKLSRPEVNGQWETVQR